MIIIPYESSLRICLSHIKSFWKLCKFKASWRKHNKENKTVASNIFPMDKVCVGKNTYGDLRVLSFGGGREGLVIGSYCSIAGDVTFLLGGEHALDTCSTYPFSRHIFGISDNPNLGTKGKIVIDDDVWIGHGVIILSGVHIGQGAVIGAGSVVAKDVPPYAVWVGNSIKRYRFPEEIIKELLNIDYSVIKEEQLNNFREYCNIGIDKNNVKTVVDVLCEKGMNGKNPC